MNRADAEAVLLVAGCVAGAMLVYHALRRWYCRCHPDDEDCRD